MDLEMTGLDPTRHVIIEIATLLTDDDLQIVAEGPQLVVHADPAQLAEMEPVVREMHERSGLTAEAESASLSLAEAGELTLAFLRQHVPPRSVPLCGNSIGTDRRFLAAQLPDLDAFFHYRSVDVSSVKELCRRWYPEVLREAPAKGRGHRALDDIRESVAELAFYRARIFRTPEEVRSADLPSAPEAKTPTDRPTVPPTAALGSEAARDVGD
jgi:oligoribonuclease